MRPDFPIHGEPAHDNEDFSIVHLYFLKADGSVAGHRYLTGPSASDRGGVTKCMPRNASGTVPAAARSIKVVVEFNNPDYHGGEESVDAYTDDIVVKFKAKSDLSVTKLSHSDNPIYATRQFTLALTVKNGGSQGYAASTATVTVSKLPAGATLLSSQPTGCTQTSAGGNITCHLSKIEYNASRDVVLTLKADANTLGTFKTIKADVSGQWDDPNTGNNSDEFPNLVIQPYADLSLQADVPAAVTKKTSGDSSYDVHVTITNTGPSKATGIVLTNTLPAQVTFVSASTPCTRAGHILTCDLGKLGANHAKTVDLNLTVPSSVAAGTHLQFSAEVSGNGHDPGPNPNGKGPLSTLLTYWDAKIGHPGPGGSVYALARSGSTLYAGGSFGVRKRSGNSWSSMGSPGGTVNALAVVSNVLYAGYSSGVKKWNGSSWVNVGSGGPSSTVRALLDDGMGHLYAGNNASVWKWAGSWSALGSPGGTVYALAIDNNTLYAGGSFGVKKWDGSSWTGVGTGLPSGTVYALAVSGYELYAGGGFYGNLARYGGSDWHPVSGLSGTVRALAANGSELFAGGDFANAGSNGDADHVARWNGVDTWTSLSGGASERVRALILSGGSIYVGGDFEKVDGTAVPSNYVGR